MAIIFSPSFLIFVFGLLLLRKTESIKAEIEKQSHFVKKWADYFFDTCHEFMKVIEHIMALLNQFQVLNNPNDERGLRYQQECSDFFPIVTELELRIRRMVCFAPKHGVNVKQTASDILAMLSEIFRRREGNFDDLSVLIGKFNKVAKLAHNEMLTSKELKLPLPRRIVILITNWHH